MRTYKIVLVYALTGLLWVFISDKLWAILDFYPQFHSFAEYESVKGGFFIIITSLILYGLIRREKRLKAISENQYRNLFAANPNPMWLYQRGSLKFVEVNDMACKTYQYGRDEFLNMEIGDLLTEENREQWIEFFKDPEGKPLASRYCQQKKKDGRQMIVSVRLNHVTFNCDECMLLMVTDVSERVKQQKRLEELYSNERKLNFQLEEHIRLLKITNEENRRLGEIINKLNNMIVICDKDGYIQWVNRAFREFTGYQMDEAVGNHPWDLLKGPKTDNKTLLSFIRSVQRSRVFSGELVGYTKEKKEYWSEIDISPFFDENDQLQGFISVETVVDERKLHQEKIREQNSVLREIARFNSHEIRKPVCSIISLSGLLKQASSDKERSEYIMLLEECARQLDEIIKEISQKVNRVEE